jgi:hypothetical protein
MEGGECKKERRGGLLYRRECASPLFVQWKELQTLCIPFNFCPVIGQITLKGKTLGMTRQYNEWNRGLYKGVKYCVRKKWTFEFQM